MEHLNLSYEDLASIICLAIHLANADDNISDSEVQAIVKSITDHYDFSGKDDLLKEYLKSGMDMDVAEAIKRVANFDQTAKQWTSNFLANTIVADGNLDESEKNLYWKIMDVCGLPDNNIGQSDNAGASSDSGEEKPLANEVYPVIAYHPFQNGIYDGLVSFFETPKPDRNKIFEFFGNPPTLTFFRSSANMDKIHESFRYSSGSQVIMLYAKKEFQAHPVPNYVGNVIAGEPVFGPILFAVEDENKVLHGISYKSDLNKFLRLLRAICGNTFLVAGDNDENTANRYYISAVTAISEL